METLQVNNLHKERVFLFLSIVIITIFLISSPGSLNSTFNFLTGASISDISTSGNNYLVGILIFIVTLIALTLFFHTVRKPKRIPIIHFSEEEKNPIHSLKTKVPLTEKLDRINLEIQDLRKEEPPSPPKIPKKKNRIVNVNERQLKKELERVDTNLQGYRKPTVINAPKREEKLKSSLSNIEEKLAKLPEMNLKRVRVKTSLPDRRLMSSMEKTKMRDEIKNISAALIEGNKNLFSFLKGFPWKKKKIEVIRGKPHNSELQKIEEKLAKLPEMNLKRVKVKTSLPERKNVGGGMEKTRIKEEIKNISKALTEGNKNPSSFLQRFPWRKRKEELIREELKKDLPKSELQDVEEKLARIKRELNS